MTLEQGEAENLERRIARANAAFESMSPVDQAIHRLQQRRSGARGLRDFDNSAEKDAAMDKMVDAMPEYVVLAELLRLRETLAGFPRLRETLAVAEEALAWYDEQAAGWR